MKEKAFQLSEKYLENLKKGRAFLVTGDGDKANVMQIGWGFVGFMWYKPYLIVAVRKSRHSHGLLENNREFVVSIPAEGEFGDELKICGTKSGKDVDKINLCGFKMRPGVNVSVPSIDGCEINLECRVRYAQDIDLELLPEEIRERSYSNGDIHLMLYGEIV